MKNYLSKKQRHKLRELKIEGTLYNISSIGELISLLPPEIKSMEDKTFYLAIRRIKNKWCVQYIDFASEEQLLGHIWYATELVDALYKAVRNFAIYNSRKVISDINNN